MIMLLSSLAELYLYLCKFTFTMSTTNQAEIMINLKTLYAALRYIHGLGPYFLLYSACDSLYLRILRYKDLGLPAWASLSNCQR